MELALTDSDLPLQCLYRWERETPDRIFLTAFDGPKLFTFCLDRATGKIMWRREIPHMLRYADARFRAPRTVPRRGAA